MADEPKPAPENQDHKVADQEPSAATLSPAPTEVAGDAPGVKPAAGADPAAAPSPPKVVEAEPLSDGTVPVVLNPGDGHKSVVKGKAGLTNIYRKADIITTLLTFVGAVVAGGLIIGGYVFFTRNKTAAPVAAPKVTKLDSADLSKLNAFFNGNSAGKPTEVLTVSSSSLFNGRVAMGSDLKVIGGTEVTGSTSLADLSVSKTSTLGVTNVRGQLTVSGPLTVANSAIFSAGASFNGNLAASGNGSFGGSISAGTLNVRDLSVGGTLNLNGHLNVGGQNSSASPASDVASSASVVGTDSAGTAIVGVKPTGTRPGADLVTVNFRTSYPTVPTVIITPVGRASALLEPYVTVTATGFTIGAANIPANGSATSYSFNYWVVQ